MINKFEFNPVNGLLNTSEFPNPQGEETTREMLNRLHIQTRDFINALVDTINLYNIENKVTSDSVKYLRVNQGIVEWSVDNESWFPLGSGSGGGSSIPGGGIEGQALIRGSAEYTARWASLVEVINVATAELNGLLSKEDKSLLDKTMQLTNNGESISAENVTETDMYTFLRNNERTQLFSPEGDLLVYSTTEADNIFQTITEADNIFQKKIQVGTSLPETAEEGDIFLLYEVE